MDARAENFSLTEATLCALRRFSLIMSSTYQKPNPIKDEDVLYSHQWAKDDYLGLDHPDRSGKNRLERAV